MITVRAPSLSSRFSNLVRLNDRLHTKFLRNKAELLQSLCIYTLALIYRLFHAHDEAAE